MKAESTIDEMIWQAVSPEAREDWAVWRAATSPKILAIFQILAIEEMDPATKDLIKDGLDVGLEADFGIPPEKSCRVYEQAEAIVRQEMETDGEA